LATNLEQFGNNLGAIWQQIWSNLATNLEQFGNNLGAIWQQIWSNLATNLEQKEQSNFIPKTVTINVAKSLI
jgi:RNAse (barnase) inhibitor barstar